MRRFNVRVVTVGYLWLVALGCLSVGFGFGLFWPDSLCVPSPLFRSLLGIFV